MLATLRRLLPVVILLPVASLAKDAPAEPPARLVFASGAVTVESQGASHPGRAGEALENGDAVSTGGAATAVIGLADGSRLKLRESGRLVLNLPGPRGTVTEAYLTLGSVFAKVTKRLPGAEFHVRTKTAVAAVRGTEFFTAFGRAQGESRDLWVCVNEGAVEVRTDAGKPPVRVPRGKGLLIKSGLDATRPQAYDWTKTLNWNMDPDKGAVADATDLDAAYSDLLDQDYH